MPRLPSGLELAVYTGHIMEPTTNWFRAPDGHFWFWVPDENAKEPPFEPGYEFLQKAVTAPVPTSVSEVLAFVRVLIRAEDGKYFWRGETLADFPRFESLSGSDRSAWDAWLVEPDRQTFLRNAIEKCRRQAEVNRHAQGYAVARGSTQGTSIEGTEVIKVALPVKSPFQPPEDTMHAIPTEDPTEAFLDCWGWAGQHLQQHAKAVGTPLAWVHWRLEPPILEHLAFRVGNQLYFVRVEDADGRVASPGNSAGIAQIARECRGVPCLLRMQARSGEWRPSGAGWGLLDLRDGKAVDPVSLATSDPIIMTDWEVHDCAVEVVRGQLEKDGCQIMSSHGNPHVDPSIWFTRNRGPEWVIVRAVRFPTAEAVLPPNWRRIATNCAALSPHGHFASVALANFEQSRSPEGTPALPLHRGGGMAVRFTGLTSLPGVA